MIKDEMLSEYDLSSKMTCREFITITGWDKILLEEEKEYSSFLDANGNLIHRCFLPVEECPLCGAKEFVYLFKKHGFDHVKCAQCPLIYTKQILDTSSDDVKWFFKTTALGRLYGDSKDTPKIVEKERIKFDFFKSVFVEYRTLGGNKLLDLGSNAGYFAIFMRESGWDVTTQETALSLVTRLRAAGLRCINQSVNKLTLPLDEYDVISVLDYLDHVSKPRYVFAELKKALKSDGLLLLSINNVESLSARILHEKSNIFIGPWHCAHYGYAAVQKVCQMFGFEMVYAKSFVSELNAVSNYMNFDPRPYFGDHSLLTNVFDIEKIAQNFMGFKITFLLRNVK